MNLRRIKRIVEENDTPTGKYFDLFIQSLIVLSLVSFSIETLPDLSNKTQSILRGIEIGTVSIFSVEYLLRLLVADKPIRFIFSFYGLIDLLAILPFYITSGIDLRAVRAFRLFRLMRVMKVFRYNDAIIRFKNAFILIKAELILFILATAFMIFISSVGIYYFENPHQPENFSSVFTSMWWAVVTLTTVGYGDIYPVTVGGRIFTAIMLLIGLGIVAIPTGLFASALTKTVDDKYKNGDSLQKD